jgi:hypothetical protein
MEISRRGGGVTMMAAEGFGTAVAFTNTRLQPGGGQERDISLAGINTVFLPFQVLLTDAAGQPRWQSIMALAGLDNLYDTRRNPAGMVTADYGPHYELPPPAPAAGAVKSEDDTSSDALLSAASPPASASPGAPPHPAPQGRDVRYNPY